MKRTAEHRSSCQTNSLGNEYQCQTSGRNADTMGRGLGTQRYSGAHTQLHPCGTDHDDDGGRACRLAAQNQMGDRVHPYENGKTVTATSLGCLKPSPPRDMDRATEHNGVRPEGNSWGIRQRSRRVHDSVERSNFLLASRGERM